MTREIITDPGLYKVCKISPVIIAKIIQMMKDDPLRDTHDGKAKRSWQEDYTCDNIRLLIFVHNEGEYDVITGVRRAQIQRKDPRY
jgi:hypothetical protein